MKKMTMIAGSLLLVLMSAQTKAHNGEMCNYQLDYDLTVKDSVLTFNQDSGKKILIDQDNQLFINDTKESLDKQQQQMVDDYADGVRDLIPEVTAIAIEGINLGVQAASMALTTLLGEGDPDSERFNYKIKDLADGFKMKLDANNFSSKQLEESIDNDFEQQIESLVEEAISELTPKLMAKILTAALSGNGGDTTDLEQRANIMEGEIKSFVEPKAEALEARAEELCEAIDRLDALETKMLASGLVMMNLIDKNQNPNDHKSKARRIKFNLGD